MSFRSHMDAALAEARAAVDECAEDVREAQAALQDARQAEETIDELRAQEKEAHKQAQKRAEVAFFYEQAVMRHARSSPSSPMSNL